MLGGNTFQCAVRLGIPGQRSGKFPCFAAHMFPFLFISQQCYNGIRKMPYVKPGNKRHAGWIYELGKVIVISDSYA